MQINTKKEAKTAVSALRRELKNLGKTPDELSHSDCLTLLAKALGHASWNEWEAKLADDSKHVAEVKPADTVPVAEPQTPRYPLNNTDGRFDFVPSGTPGAPYSAWFWRLVGTHERIYGTANITGATRAGGDLQVDYEGYTNVDWDSQTTVRGPEGAMVWLGEGGDYVHGLSVILLPAEYELESEDLYVDEDLPVREALVAEYVDYFRTKAISEELSGCKTQGARNKVTNAAQKLLGFWLTKRELNEVLRRISN